VRNEKQVLILGDRIEVHNPSDPDGKVVGQKNTRSPILDCQPDCRDGMNFYRLVTKNMKQQHSYLIIQDYSPNFNFQIILRLRLPVIS
ncbi:MAG TPA: hypothetical protein VJL34_10920, partial [Anaerolineales bacterium]|nr:hypothetical protein [Anaerolineales bacterium]